MKSENRFVAILSWTVMVLLLVAVSQGVVAKKPPKPDPPQAPVQYELKILPSPDPTNTRMTEAWDVNDEGTVVGRIRFPNDEWERALVWWPQDGAHTWLDLTTVFTDLGLLPSGTALGEAGCINNAGLIAGGTFAEGTGPGTGDWGTGIFACNLDATPPFLKFLPLPETLS